MTTHDATATALNRANAYADEAQALLVDQAIKTLDDDVRAAVTKWVTDAREFFPTGSGWSLQHVREERLPIRHATENLAHQVATIYLTVARAARRAAFARAYVVAKAQQKALLDKTLDPVDVMVNAGAVKLVREAGAWSEELHPRVPKGSPEGGEFAAMHARFAQGLQMLRRDMPQVPTKHRDKFLNLLAKDGIQVRREMVDAASLKPTQVTFHQTKVAEMLARDYAPNEKPILISGDNYVLDGHHRWVIAVMRGEQMAVFRIGLSIKELVARGNAFDIFQHIPHEEADSADTDLQEAEGTEPRRVARALVLEPDGRVYVLVWPNGTVQLPGGGIEEGEDGRQAAMRETWEEAGLRIEVDGWLCAMNDQYASRDYYLASAPPRMQEAEHIDPDGGLLVNVECIPAEDAMAMLTSPYDRAAVGTYLNSLAPRGTHDGTRTTEAFDPAQHPRGKTTVDSTPGSFAPNGGAPLEATIETPAFKAWFGDSRVVDEHGKPLVVYHGTTVPIEEFSTKHANATSALGAGIYFTNTAADAGTNYADLDSGDLRQRINALAASLFVAHEKEHGIHTTGSEMKDLYARFKKQAASELSGGSPNIIPVYLSLQNPVIIGGKDETKIDGVSVRKFIAKINKEHDDSAEQREISRRAFIAHGYDGIIDHTAGVKFRRMGGVERSTVHYVAFRSNQIKSVYNRGAFSSSTTNISEAAFNPVAHPRVPGGSPEGGEFASKGGVADSVAEGAPLIAAYMQAHGWKNATPEVVAAFLPQVSEHDRVSLQWQHPTNTVSLYGKGDIVIHFAVFPAHLGGVEDPAPSIEMTRSIEGNRLNRMMLEVSTQQRGIGSAQSARDEDFARTLGLKMVTMSAVTDASAHPPMVGAYVWAKLGYDFARPSERSREVQNYIAALEVADLPGVKSGVISRSIKTAHDLAIHQHDGKPTGKLFLLGQLGFTKVGYDAVKHLN